MKRTNKKGFTIVELVVVIAIIAILAAVLIPTFSSLIKRANVSKDNQLVRNLNTALAADAALNGKHETMYSALKAAEDAGYIVERINASAKDNEILWDSVNDVFCYRNGDSIEYIPEAPKAQNADDYQYWIIASEPSTQYSTYLYKATTDTFDELKTGLDVGNETVASITYVGNGTAQDVVIRTNSAETKLIINAVYDTVEHHGIVGRVEIEKIDFDCYYENGTAAFIKLDQGKVVAKTGGTVEVLFTTNATATAVAAIENGGVIKAGYTTGEPIDIANRSNDGGIPLTYVINEMAITGEESIQEIVDRAIDQVAASETDYWIDAAAENFAGGTGTELDPYLISSATQLARIAKVVNVVNSEYNDKYYKLTKNINLSGKIWTPIGYESNSFAGVIDGNNKTIIGLSNYNENSSLTSMADDNNHAYGLVGVAALSKGNVIIKNLTLDSVDINITGGKGNGAVLGYLLSESGVSSKMTISGISVNGNISSNGHSGGIIGKIYGLRAEINNCENNATVSGTNAAGIANYCSNGSLVIEISDCTNNGNITANGNGSYVSGIVNLVTVSSATITNCLNTGEIKNTNNGTIKIGGIIANGTGPITMYNLENRGKVSALNSATGGIIGSVISNITIKAGYLKNSGEIIGKTVAGGIFGETKNGKTIAIDLSNETDTSKQKIDLINEGIVTVSDIGTSNSVNHPYGAGAIIGYLGSNHSEFNKCNFINNNNINNSGNITAPEGSHTGLIAGSVANAGYTFTNCSYNNEGLITNLESNMDLTTYNLSNLPNDSNTQRIFGFIPNDTGTTSFIN